MIKSARSAFAVFILILLPALLTGFQISCSKNPVKLAVKPTPAQSPGTDWSAFEARRDWMLSLNLPAPQPANNWHPLSATYALADFYKNAAGTPKSNAAVIATIDQLRLIGTTANVPASFLAGSEFYPLAVVRAIYQFEDRFTPEQLAQIGSDAQRMYYWYGGGTENHHQLRLSNAYLLAQKFPSGLWYTAGAGSTRVDSATLMARNKEELRRQGQLRYERSFYEAFSPNYFMANFMPLLNLYDFAEDPEVKNIAEAMILHMLAQLSVNVYRGYILDPYHRFVDWCFTNGGSSPDNYSVSPTILRATSNTAMLLTWLYWNQCAPDASRFAGPSYGDNAYLIHPAISGYRPLPAFDRIANISSDTPGKAHWVRTSEPEWPVGLPDRDDRIIGADRRRVWRDREFAVGSSVGYFTPGTTHVQTGAKFGIAYRSTDRLHYIQAGHPYALADESGLNWWKGPYSPFMQVAHDKDTAIVMFNIPPTDPWPDIPSARTDFWLTDRTLNPPRIRRSEHANGLRTDCAMRYPLTMDETSEVDNADGTKWYFLREGETYIGIRTLTAPSEPQQDAFWKSITVNAIPHGGRSQTGFIVEIGSSVASGGQFASFDKFKAALAQRQPLVTWGSGSTPTLSVEYTNPRNVNIRTEYDTNLAADKSPNSGGKVRMFPNVWVNGAPDAADPWPDIDARLDDMHPLVTLANKVLTITNPDTGLATVVDWNDRMPVIHSYRP